MLSLSYCPIYSPSQSREKRDFYAIYGLNRRCGNLDKSVFFKLGFIENLNALKLDLKALTTQTEKPCEEFVIFITYLPQWPQM